MNDRLGWLSILLPVAVIGGIEVLSDTMLDPYLPFPWDTVVVLTVIGLFGFIYWRIAVDRTRALASALAARNAELEQRNRTARALHHVSVAIAALADIDQVVQAVVDQARRLLNADVALLVLTSGDQSTLRAGSGPPGAIDPDADRGGSDVVRFVDPSLVAVRLAAPLQRGGQTNGLLVVGCSEPRSFDVDDVEALSSLANQAAIALENDRLQGRLRELAVVTERERIAREMHDGLAQVLGYVNTKSQAVETLLASGRVPEARGQLAELAAAARSVYVDVREAILGLRSPIRPEVGLVGAIEEYAARFAEASKLVARVDATPGARARELPAPVEAQVFRIVQEALTNVRKHASAQRVSVSLDVADDELRIAIADDGRGFDPEAVPSGDWPHFGLEAIRERAAEIGGDVSWTMGETAAGRADVGGMNVGGMDVGGTVVGGTRLTVTVPLRPATTGAGRDRMTGAA